MAAAAGAGARGHRRHRRERVVVQNQVGSEPLRLRPSHLEVLRHCFYVTQVCRQYLLTRPSAPLHGASKIVKELEERVLENDVAWSLVHADSNGRQTLLDVAIIAIAYARIAASPDPGSFNGVGPQTPEQVIGLQIKLRRMMKEYHLDPTHAMEVVRDMPRVMAQCQRAIVSVLSMAPELKHAEVPEAGAGVGLGSRFSDIDMHAEYENRARVLENKDEEKGDNKQDEGPGAVALCPFRFVELCGRLYINVMYELDTLSKHRHLPTCTLEYDTCYRKVVELTTFTVTSGTEKLIQRYVGLSGLPLGSQWSALRTRNGKWSATAVTQLVRDELGVDKGNTLMESSIQEARHVFAEHHRHAELRTRTTVADFRKPPWNNLHDQWALVFMSRWMHAQISVDPTPLYFVRRCDIRRYKDHVRATKHNMRHKRPLILQVCGGWYVQSVSVDFSLQLQACPQGLLQAICCWAHTFHKPPYRGRDGRVLDIRDVDISEFLADFVNPEDIPE